MGILEIKDFDIQSSCDLTTESTEKSQSVQRIKRLYSNVASYFLIKEPISFKFQNIKLEIASPRMLKQRVCFKEGWAGMIPDCNFKSGLYAESTDFSRLVDRQISDLMLPVIGYLFNDSVDCLFASHFR